MSSIDNGFVPLGAVIALMGARENKHKDDENISVLFSVYFAKVTREIDNLFKK